MSKTVTENVIKAIHHNLKDFGYDVTLEFVGQQVDKVLRGEKTGIIGQFALTMLIENGYLAEEEA